jgi:anti-sigma factor RsiW
MKEKRFIELLNLYVDHQLAPAETGELETELKSNPARHRIYLQYAHMQKACSILFEAERCNAPSAGILARAMAKADRRVEHPAGFRTAWSRGLFAFGGLAVAACVAMVLVRFDGGPAQPPSSVSRGAQVAVIETAEAVEVPASISVGEIEKPMHAVVTVPALARRNESPAYPVMNLRQFAAFDPKAGAGLAMPAVSYVDSAGLQWTQDVRIRPIRRVAPDNLFFERHDLTSEEMRALFEIRPVLQKPAEEMTVLQFQH